MIRATLSLLAAAAFCDPSPSRALAPADAEAVTREILREREDTRRWLKSDPASYLAAVQRRDFGSKRTMSVGSSEDNDVRLRDAGVRPSHLRVTLAGDGFRVEAADPGARFTVKKGTTPLREASVGPSSIGVGRFSLRLSHQGYPAIIVFDPQSPGFKRYKGVRYFPVDPAYRYVVRLIPDPKPEAVTILATHSDPRRALRIGWFEFLAGKTPCRIAAYRLLEPGVAEDAVSVFFRDATTGKESYPVGRYVDPKRLPDGAYLLDFNLAYNPACAYSKHYNCPIPPRENALPVAIRAGEMDPRYH